MPLPSIKVIMLNSTEQGNYHAQNAKMPTTIGGILTFISRVNTAPENFKQEKSKFFSILVLMSNRNFMLS